MPTHHAIPNSCVLSLFNLFKCAYVHVGGVKSKPNHRAQSGRRYVYTYILFQAYIRTQFQYEVLVVQVSTTALYGIYYFMTFIVGMRICIVLA